MLLRSSTVLSSLKIQRERLESLQGDGIKMEHVYDLKENCCGCTACANICPKGAIKMNPDGEGFLYPVIDMRG